MRRVLLAVALALVGVVAVVGVGVAGSGDSDSRDARTEPKPVAAEREGARDRPRGHRGFGHGMFGLVVKQVLASSADRLGVTEEQLKAAARAVGQRAKERRFAAADLTTAERAALEVCHRGRGHHRRGHLGRERGHRGRGHEGRGRGDRARGDRGRRARNRQGSGCDRGTARAALAKLKASKGKIDLAAEKQTLADDLGKELKIDPAKVLEAVRAELVERLGQAVGLGLVTEKGRELALGCFDTPASCDVKALRAEVKFRGFGGRRHR